MALLLHKVCLVIYITGAIIGFVQLFSRRLANERVGAVALSVGVTCHVAALCARGVELGSFPMASAHDGMSLFAFTAGIFATYLGFRSRVPQVAPIGCVLVAAIMAAAVLVEPAAVVPEKLRSPWMPIHVALAFLANASFAVAGIVSVVYLVHEHRLRRKRIRTTGLHSLPALEILDRLSLRLIEIGFPLMTLALLSGALYGKTVWGSYWSWEPRTIVNLLVWVLYALLLQFRITIGWRGRKAAYVTVIGVTLTLISMGLGFLGIGLHAQDYTS